MHKIIVITGPTATGKSALGVAVAKQISGEIVSADSMQIYKHMDIGTAKPSLDERQGVPHHMIDIVEPWDEYSVASYVEDAAKCIEDIIQRGKNPILVGGTGLYIDSLISGRVFSDRGDVALRKELQSEYDQIGGDAMLRKLRELDPGSADKLHPNDRKRIVRSFEVYLSTGKTISQHDDETKTLPPRYNAIKFALMLSDRAKLYDGIDRRVDMMVENGLLSEVRSLLEMGVLPDCTAMQAIGYKELIPVILEKLEKFRYDSQSEKHDHLVSFDGALTEKDARKDTFVFTQKIGAESLADATKKIKQESRRYAKRQLTWLRRDESVQWVFTDEHLATSAENLAITAEKVALAL